MPVSAREGRGLDELLEALAPYLDPEAEPEEPDFKVALVGARNAGKSTMVNALAEDERVMKLPEPFVLFQDFGASSLDFELRCYTGDVVRRVRIASDLRFAIDRRFREEGIEIPFPQRVVHMVPTENGD